MPSFGSAFDLLLVILGFGLIIFVHELGHFLAARWAGVRVLAFALGFGPAMISYRKGLGWRRGSSEPEYLALAQSATHSGGGEIVQDGREVHPTEYRLNTLPFGGYVKMLGQEDLNPNAVSQSPDSYQRAAVWKRMVIISAGVVMNIITAGFIFMGVFLVGLKTEPPKVGDLSPGKPAAMALSTTSVGGTKTPLLPGDEIVLINGERPRSFNDLMVATAMGARGRDVELSVKREGVAEPIAFSITPERNRMTNLMELGVSPFRSARIVSDVPAAQLPEFTKALEQRGLVGVRPGMTLVIAGGKPAKSAADMLAAARASGGKPVELMFADDAGTKVAASLTPVPEMQSSLVEVGGMITSLQHVLGLTPVMAVGDPGRAASQGLKAGDIFVRLGSVECPTLATGIAEIRARAGGEIDAIVSRAGEDGKSIEQPLTLKVSSAGAVGFLADDSGSRTTLVARPPEFRVAVGKASGSEPSPASRLNLRPGSTIKAIGSTPVSTIVELQAALKDQVRQHAKPDGGAAIELQIQAPLAAPGGEPQTETQSQTIAWDLSAAEVASLSALGWTSPISDGIFEPEQFVMKATGPWDAVMTGAHETKRVMVMTYLTFARLFDGTVKVEHLKGPVGIAHVGTVIADKGLIWLLFFMGLISVNLAVINFMPLPIVDGGQFVFLLVEAISGRPVSIAIQNVATIAGLVLIGSVFLIVTFNDVMNLIRP